MMFVATSRSRRRIRRIISQSDSVVTASAGRHGDVGAAQLAVERRDPGRAVAPFALFQRHDHVRVGLALAIDLPATILYGEVVQRRAVGELAGLRVKIDRREQKTSRQ
jgi:hypothetical protein